MSWTSDKTPVTVLIILLQEKIQPELSRGKITKILLGFFLYLKSTQMNFSC